MSNLGDWTGRLTGGVTGVFEMAVSTSRRSRSGRARMRSVQTLAAVLVATLVSGVASAASASDLAVVGAKVYPAPDAPAITNAVLLVHDGRIQVIGPRGAVTIPAGAAILDETGKVITAGFWNNHVHLLTPILIDEKNQTDAALTLELDRMFTRRRPAIFAAASRPALSRAPIFSPSASRSIHRMARPLTPSRSTSSTTCRQRKFSPSQKRWRASIARSRRA